MGSRLGALKTAAKRVGVSLGEYLANMDNGLKYCWVCGIWHPASEFQRDRNKGDGRKAICRKVASQRLRKPELIVRRRAHRLIQMRVRRGLLPVASSVPCVDCGHIGPDRRHEHDHYLGYEGSAKYRVQVVCSLCHADRHKERRNG